MKIINIESSESAYLTKKYVFQDVNNRTIESVYVDRVSKNIICLSSMYGCSVGCTFCKSGENFYGIASYEDIVDMCDMIVTDNKINPDKKTVFSFMGSGEPLLNPINVCNAINYINSKYYNSKVSVSFSGVGFKNFKQMVNHCQIQPKFQFSLHSAYNSERIKLIPNSNTLELILDELDKYCIDYNTSVELNYILLDGINDSMGDVFAISDIFSRYKHFTLKINEYHVVNYNYIESLYKSKFIENLRGFGIFPEIYSTDGIEIGAACGQLKSIVNAVN